MGALALAGVASASLPFSSPVRATNGSVLLTEVAAGVNGDSTAQFIELQLRGTGKNLWGPQSGESESRAMLVFFDKTGVRTGEHRFAANAPETSNRFVLVGTTAFKNLPGSPDPDIVIPALVNPTGGRICFRNNPRNPNAAALEECVAYGPFPVAQNPGFGSPVTGAGDLNVLATRSAQRKLTGGAFSTTDNNAIDWALVDSPNPTKSGTGAPGAVASASDVVRGRNLFSTETFGGNGRTCATCHNLDKGGSLSPLEIKNRFATLPTTFDPLFVAEPNLNLNKLRVRGNSPTAPIVFAQGAILTGTTGSAPVKAKVLTAIGPDEYLVLGGFSPKFQPGSNVSDGARTLVVDAIDKGSLDALENPERMKKSTNTTDFPNGRGLILENIDGIGLPHNLRKSPHLQNLKHSGPFGFSSMTQSLDEFTLVAVRQHFPRTLARKVEGDPGVTQPDFRMPTTEEKRLITVFLESLETVPGDVAPFVKFGVTNFARTAQQKRGNGFFASCVICHASPVLSGIFGTRNIRPPVNTGIANQAINGPGADNLPTEPPGRPFGESTRAFDIPSLFNLRDVGPFFHDGSAPTLEAAIRFYGSSNFQNAVGFSIPFDPAQVTDVAAFLRGLQHLPTTVTLGITDLSRGDPQSFADTRLAFGDVPLDKEVSHNLVVKNNGTTALAFGGTPCVVTAFNSIDTPADFTPDCAAIRSISLAAGDSRTIKVKFKPRALGNRTAILEINAPDPTGLNLVGNGVPVNGANLTACTQAPTHFLVGTQLPNGELLQPIPTNRVGATPTKQLFLENTNHWSTEPVYGRIEAGLHQVSLFTDNTGGVANVRVDLGIADGFDFLSVGTLTRDVNSTGGGNHRTTFDIQVPTTVPLVGQRVSVRVTFKGGGAPNPPTLIYNGGLDFPSRIESGSRLCTAPAATGLSLPIALHLVNPPATGVNPAGKRLQTFTTGAVGFSPTLPLDATKRSWYTDPLSANLPAGKVAFRLWTNSPGAAAPTTFELHRTDVAGNNAVLLARKVLDINATGGGNHTSLFDGLTMPAQNLTGHRFRVTVWNTGRPATMVFNGGLDFDTRLELDP